MMKNLCLVLSIALIAGIAVAPAEARSRDYGGWNIGYYDSDGNWHHGCEDRCETRCEPAPVACPQPAPVVCPPAPCAAPVAAPVIQTTCDIRPLTSGGYVHDNECKYNQVFVREREVCAPVAAPVCETPVAAPVCETPAPCAPLAAPVAEPACPPAANPCPGVTYETIEYRPHSRAEFWRRFGYDDYYMREVAGCTPGGLVKAPYLVCR